MWVIRHVVFERKKTFVFAKSPCDNLLLSLVAMIGFETYDKGR